jgi:hypothetical protein
VCNTIRYCALYSSNQLKVAPNWQAVAVFTA